jgi:hypothetical protein
MLDNSNEPMSSDSIKPIREMTGDELSGIKKYQLKALLKHAGSTNDLSRMLSLAYPIVRGWELRNQISKRGARQVETHKTLGEYFKATDLRPDLNI